MSPKYHCELAGDGIEYSWGKAKFFFRRHNPGKEPATRLAGMVRDALRTVAVDDKEAVLPLCRVRKFGAAARRYRRAYIAAAQGGEAVPYVDLEKMRQTFVAHRCACDFARALIEQD